jgi:formylmethanofuran dehydrogenase subunit C
MILVISNLDMVLVLVAGVAEDYVPVEMAAAVVLVRGMALGVAMEPGFKEQDMKEKYLKIYRK